MIEARLIETSARVVSVSNGKAWIEASSQQGLRGLPVAKQLWRVRPRQILQPQQAAGGGGLRSGCAAGSTAWC